MDAYRMTVRFERTDEGRCRVMGRAHDRRPFQISCMGGRTSPDRLPHDLSTFVVEQVLGVSGGFFNLTAHGATFRSHDRRRTRPGRAVIAANRTALDDAERIVHAHESAWAQGRPSATAGALETARRDWHALAPGEGFDLVWTRLPLPRRPTR